MTMDKKVKDFLISQHMTEAEIEARPNVTFLKVELMLQNALNQGKNLPLDSVVGQSEQLPCEHPFASVMSKCNGEINKCLKCGEEL